MVELITSNPDIKMQHCYLSFDIPSSDFTAALQLFNEKMRAQLSTKGTQTPGKIMHTKVFQEKQIRCYFAYTPSQAYLDWRQWVTGFLE